jgi:hypothetical protein
MVLDELGSTAYYVHDYQTGYAACEALLKGGKLPPSEVERVNKNFAAYKERLIQIQAMQAQMAPKPEAVAAINKNIKTFKKRKT